MEYVDFLSLFGVVENTLISKYLKQKMRSNGCTTYLKIHLGYRGVRLNWLFIKLKKSGTVIPEVSATLCWT